MDFFEKSMGPNGGAKVGHKDTGKFLVQFAEDDDRTMEIAWTVAGTNAAYGYASRPVEVAMARFAKAFDEVDDPAAYEFRHSVRVAVAKSVYSKGLKPMFSSSRSRSKVAPTTAALTISSALIIRCAL